MIDQDKIRQLFIDHYGDQGYELLPRAKLLHPSIPMSFVMSAGLVQVESVLAEQKKIFSGNKFVLVQRCFRYFDMDKVGLDNRHLSLFDMAGAFVFGVDPERDAIPQLWDFITQTIGIDPTRIWATYFAGAQINGKNIPADERAKQRWVDMGLNPDRIVGLKEDDNFWVQGPGLNFDDNTPYVRKCGPHTELFYDFGEHMRCGMQCRPGCSCGRFIEFANILFVEFEIDKKTGFWSKMDTPFVESVIGVERVTTISQRGISVFDLPKYQRLIQAIEQRIPDNLDLPCEWKMFGSQVIADHILALYTLVSDGAPKPGKDGRARIMKLLIRQVVTQQMVLKISNPYVIKALIENAALILDPCPDNRAAVSSKLLRYYENARKIFEKTVIKGIAELNHYLELNGGRDLSGCQVVALEKEKGLPHTIIRAEMHVKGITFPAKDYHQSLVQWRTALQEEYA